MNQTIFSCSFCEDTFSTQRGLKHHTTRIHIDLKTKITCGKCNKQYSTKSNRDKHESKCTNTVNNIVVDTMKELAKEVKSLKEQQQQVQPQQIINNITNNITNNNGDVNNYNNHGTYTQTNNILTSGLENLIPITNKGIVEQMKQMFADVTQNRKLLLSPKDLGEKISTNVFKGSLLSTDSSRGIMHWKDGDDNNKHVKDPQCAILSTKMYNALLDKKDEVTAPYKEFVDTLRNNINQDTGFERSESYHASSALLTSLDNEETMKAIGKSISKAPVIPKLKQTYKLDKFVKILKDLYHEKPYIFMFQDSNGVGVGIKKALEIHCEFSINDDEIILIDDDKNKIKMHKSSFFDLVKECLLSFSSHFSFLTQYFLNFPNNYETIKRYVESKDVAKTNAANYHKWLNDELNGDEQVVFEKSLLRMLSLR